MKKSLLLTLIVSLALVAKVNALPLLPPLLSGYLDISQTGKLYSTHSPTSSLTLNVLNQVIDTDGDFDVITSFSNVTAFTPGTTGSKATNPIAVIPTGSTSNPLQPPLLLTPTLTSLLSFDPLPPGGPSAFRFVFSLTSIKYFDGSYYGIGTITDTTGAFAPTPTDFDMGFSTHGYTISLTAAPEPQTWALLFGGLFVLGVLARRKAALLK